jgi:hypothetical protein
MIAVPNDRTILSVAAVAAAMSDDDRLLLSLHIRRRTVCCFVGIVSFRLSIERTFRILFDLFWFRNGERIATIDNNIPYLFLHVDSPF